MKKYVYMFSEGNAKMRETLGGKGANLAEMTNLGIPVPQGFIVSTDVCVDYYNNDKKLSKNIEKEVFACLKKLEEITGKKYASNKNPLILSVRSGARVSMPGMMDSVLNLGLNDEITESLAKSSGNEWFAYDSYRRFIQMYANVVKGLDMADFENILTKQKVKKNIKMDTEFTVADLKTIIKSYKKLYFKKLATEFPQEPNNQLIESIISVLNSWNNPRAITYRRLNDIPDNWGTAVNVQQMVFGNMGENCLTGVAFSRNPVNGENELYGEYLFNAQGEDIVSGVRTPFPIDHLKTDMPKIYNEFSGYARKLDKHYKDMQELEFTVENGKLFILQTRNGKRTAKAMVKIATDMVKDKILTKQEALLSIDADALQALLHPQFESTAIKQAKVIGNGLPASPGCGYGRVVFDSVTALALSKKKQDIILVRQETSAEDIDGMHASKGVITARGGMTSHAAVIARGMGIPCVAGTENLVVNEDERYCILNGKKIKEGEYLSIDGSTGSIYLDKLQAVPPVLSSEFKTIMKWSNEYRRLKVMANADTEKDALQAREYGAEGIGLCRTEHMFFNPERIKVVRQMIVADNEKQRKTALNKLLPIQKGDFVNLFKAMKGCPVTIRFIDPPLHEFLPKEAKEIKDLAKDLKLTEKQLISKINSLKEVNPMMGHRGCRLSITYPEIAVMQTKAIIEAALEVKKNFKITVEPEIMVPLTCDLNEFKYVKDIIIKTATEILSNTRAKINYKVGTMIEVPRSALIADELATEAEFFSFGTNDLTQLTYGFSRDDAGKFLNDYYDKKIFSDDPFAQMDPKGVGKLVETAIKLAKPVRNDIELGICGEHGGDPKTVDYCNRIGLTYVSCSPYRVPIAILASAQSELKKAM